MYNNSERSILISWKWSMGARIVFRLTKKLFKIIPVPDAAAECRCTQRGNTLCVLGTFPASIGLDELFYI